MTDLKCCGCLPDPRDLRHHSDFDKLGLAAGTEQWPSLRSFAGPVLNQRSTSSCVAHGILDAERTTLRARHLIDAPLGSRLQLYLAARFRRGIHIEDEGCYPSDAIAALEADGIAPEHQWPFEPANVNKRPPASAQWDARERRGMRDTYAIHNGGDQLIAALRAALNAKRAVCMTIPVDRAMQRSSGLRLIRFSELGDTIGHHYVEIVSLQDNDGTCVEIKNSWGSGWRDDGYACLDEGFLTRGRSYFVIDPKEPPR